MLPIKLELPEGFLDEEERCGYTVSSEMKKVWAIELDLFSEFDRVCKKHGITYYADGGTLLGAVRHGGFIPWDDDLDLIMFRDQYVKICEVAPHEFAEPYFFQTEYTDPGSMRGHAQLRNSDTTGILKEEEGKYSFNQGIFIDIFVLDAVHDDESVHHQHIAKIQKYKKRALTAAAYSTRYIPSKSPVKRLIKLMLYKTFSGIIRKFKICERYYRRFELECARFNNLETQQISNLSLASHLKRSIRLRDGYQAQNVVTFEFLSIPIPVGFDDVLIRHYGDYQKYVIGGSLHGSVIFDTEKTYKLYNVI